MKTVLLAVATLAVASVTVGVLWTLGEFHATLAHADAAITSLSGVVEQERAAQRDQTREFNKTLANVHDLIIHTDLQLNGNKNHLGVLPQMLGLLIRTDFNVNGGGSDTKGIFPDADHALKALTLDAHDTFIAVQGTTEAAHSSLDSLTVDFDGLHSRIDDPRIDSILGNIQSTSFEIAGTTADVHAEIHKLVFPPPRKWYQKYLLDPLKVAAHLITIPISSF